MQEMTLEELKDYLKRLPREQRVRVLRRLILAEWRLMPDG